MQCCAYGCRQVTGKMPQQDGGTQAASFDGVPHLERLRSAKAYLAERMEATTVQLRGSSGDAFLCLAGHEVSETPASTVEFTLPTARDPDAMDFGPKSGDDAQVRDLVVAALWDSEDASALALAGSRISDLDAELRASTGLVIQLESQVAAQASEMNVLREEAQQWRNQAQDLRENRITREMRLAQLEQKLEEQAEQLLQAAPKSSTDYAERLAAKDRQLDQLRAHAVDVTRELEQSQEVLHALEARLGRAELAVLRPQASGPPSTLGSASTNSTVTGTERLAWPPAGEPRLADSPSTPLPSAMPDLHSFSAPRAAHTQGLGEVFKADRAQDCAEDMRFVDSEARVPTKTRPASVHTPPRPSPLVARPGATASSCATPNGSSPLRTGPSAGLGVSTRTASSAIASPVRPTRSVGVGGSSAVMSPFCVSRPLEGTSPAKSQAPSRSPVPGPKQIPSTPSKPERFPAAGASATELGCAWQLIQSCKTGTPASPTPRFVVCRPAHDTTPGSSAQGPLLPGVSQSSSPAPRAAGYHLSRTSGTTPPRQPPPSLSSLWMYSPQAASADVAPAGPGCRSTSPVRTGSDSVGPVVPPLLRAVPTPMGRSAQSSDRLWTPTPPTGSRPQAVTSASASVPLSQGRLWVHPPAI
mmetsp:Transcript_54112/g.107721  ORF Transcript_54112/g.107721 Transcript_54112/m.107721 type:complete len:644 (+) Transcript_54112:1-1932(+)